MTYEFTMTAEAMLPGPHLPWWRRWALKLLRRLPPAPRRPEGTVPMMFENRNADGTTTRFFYPAARIQPLPAVPDARRRQPHQ